MAGRPSKISDKKLISRICESISKGNTHRAAAGAAGISEATFYGWIKRAEEKQEPEYLEFLDAIKKAESDSEEYYLNIIHYHAVKSWQCAAWWLERRKAGDYSRQDRLDVTSKGEKLERKWEIVDPLPLNGLHTNGNGKKKQAEA